MNIFLPQSIQTQIELEELADVKRQIITPSTSRTIIGIVQDGLLGAYNLTAPTMRIDWRSAMNIMAYTSLEDFKTFKKDVYTGHELFSLIIPKAINVSRKVGGEDFVIKDGQLSTGRLSKDVLGSKKKNAVHQLVWDEYGPEETKNFIDNTQRLLNNFILFDGMSVGFGDAVVPNSVTKEINKMFETKEQKVNKMITEIEQNPGLMEKDVFEFKLFSELNIIRDDASKLVMQNLKPENNFNIMILSGSKGDATTMGQMSGCLGLQAFEGRLIPKKYNERTLAYYHQNDDRAESRGLVKQSYMDGLEFPSFTYILLAGREGLINSAIGTADSGYAQRRLIKSMEDLMIKYDGTVRTANNTLIQVTYGDSGADTTKQFEYTIKIVSMGDKQLEAKHKFDSKEMNEFKDYKLNNQVFEMIKQYRNLLRTNIIKAKANFITLTDTFMLPINLTRIVDNYNNKKRDTTDKLSPQYVYERLEDIMLNKHTMLMCLTKDESNNKSSLKNKDEQVAKLLFKIALYDALSPKRCVIEYGFGKRQFDMIIEEIIDNFNKNIVQPGEMVGIIGAQSMGEPLTQMTLNSFHHSGIASMSTTTQGIPRVKEILSFSKKTKTPQLVIYLTREFKTSKEMSHKIASHIKFTTLGDIRGRIEVFYDPKPYEKGGPIDQDGIKNVFFNQKSTKNSCQGDINGLPWLMRIEIDREKMLEKEVTLLEIKSKFCNWWEKRHIDAKTMKKEEKKVINKITSIAVMSNSDGDKQPVIHIRFNGKDTDKVKDPFNRETLNHFIDHIIDKFKLKGLDGINDIPAIAEERMLTFNKETNDVEYINQQVIFTAGVNLKEIRYIIGIDAINTICNDIAEVYNTFGIEIARARLMRELSIAYERGGHSVNYQNLSLLVDIMTSSGTIMSVDRHGMNKSESDPLARASFEKSVEQLITAAVFGEVDYMRCVSSRVMAGLVVKGGTGFCDVLLDTNMIAKSSYTDESNVYGQFTEITTENIASDIINKGNSDIFMPL